MPDANAAPSGIDLNCGVQLWMLRDEIQRDFEGTLRHVAEIGLRRVELFELGGRSAARTRAGIDAAGLECITAHVRLWELDADLPNQIRLAHEIGVRNLIVPLPWMPPDVLARALNGQLLEVLSQEMSLDHWKKTAERLNFHGERLHQAGLSLAYHNHNIDFKQFDGLTAYETLVTTTDPRFVRLELDCGWVASAGLECTALLKRWPRRYVALHLKDVGANLVPNVAMTIDSTEVGSGRLDWPAILRAAWAAGVREYYIEQEAPYIRPPLDSLEISFDYLAKITHS